MVSSPWYSKHKLISRKWQVSGEDTFNKEIPLTVPLGHVTEALPIKCSLSGHCYLNKQERRGITFGLQWTKRGGVRALKTKRNLLSI